MLLLPAGRHKAELVLLSREGQEIELAVSPDDTLLINVFAR